LVRTFEADLNDITIIHLFDAILLVINASLDDDTLKIILELQKLDLEKVKEYSEIHLKLNSINQQLNIINQKRNIMLNYVQRLIEFYRSSKRKIINVYCFYFIFF